MLDYLVDAPPPKLEVILMKEFADELEIATGVAFIYKGRSKFFADRIILFRILLNLARNEGVVGANGLQIDNGRASHPGVIDILDNCTGISNGHAELLFRRFKGQRLAAI